MEPEFFIAQQESPRKEILLSIHSIISQTNKKVKAEVSDMMGKEMIIYKLGGHFIYALSSVKSHMSLHLMPIYSSAALHNKYSKLLNKAKFQKGCINFKSAEEVPLNILKQLMTECSKIDYLAIVEKYMASKQKKKS
jgi:uncharacterized protein YdhG (YjbR/CyaY superfamily)